MTILGSSNLMATYLFIIRGALAKAEGMCSCRAQVYILTFCKDNQEHPQPWPARPRPGNAKGIFMYCTVPTGILCLFFFWGLVGFTTRPAGGRMLRAAGENLHVRAEHGIEGG